MSSLSDQIDRLSRHSSSISSTANLTASTFASTSTSTNVAGPFTRAVLHTNLGDLIRDVDPSELGLFSLVAAPAKQAGDNADTRNAPPALAPAEFPGATPLRKPKPKKDDPRKPKELEPEIYAQAALRYINRYEQIRPMPRAHAQAHAISEQIKLVSTNIQNLEHALEEAQGAEAQPLTETMEDEERRVEKLQAIIDSLKRRKEVALKQRLSKEKPSQPKAPPPKGKAKATEPPGSPQDAFWNTPVAPKTYEVSGGLILDEEHNLGDVSMSSFMSPLPPSPPRGHLSQLLFDASPTRSELAGRDSPLGVSVSGEEPMEAEEDKTITLKSVAPPESPQEVRPPSSLSSKPQTPKSQVGASEPGTATRMGRVRLGSEVERIVAKIWQTMGDVIMPGHAFTFGEKKFRAKETIAHLQSLATTQPSPSSPSASSASSASNNLPVPPTSQQILTAHLLVSMLEAPPHYSIPFNHAKDLLTAKTNEWGASLGVVRQGSPSIIYGCVAKRLLKIDRGGGKQVVKFDI